MSGLKKTLAMRLVLRALLEKSPGEVYGRELCALAELPSGTVHPILTRLEGAGWLASRWEDVDPHEQGRPPRRYYRFTADGNRRAREILTAADAVRASLRAGKVTREALALVEAARDVE